MWGEIMSDVSVEITWDVDKKSYDVKGNARDPKSIVSRFLDTQIGKGEDESPREDRDEYRIRIELDLQVDTFTVYSNCGNKGLRDGILLGFVNEGE